jgi:hypothetical protein
MPFTGKPTFAAGTDLPELVEDVSDVIGIVSPWETPLLDYLGDPKKAATSTVHEWIEDTLLPNTDAPPNFPTRDGRLCALGTGAGGGLWRTMGRHSGDRGATSGGA